MLTFPDFRGNFQFNTLGNLLVNPRAPGCSSSISRRALSLP